VARGVKKLKKESKKGRRRTGD